MLPNKKAMVASSPTFEAIDLRELEMTSILMLDDGVGLKRQFDALTDVPYMFVTLAKTGAEAVREIMETDFDVIICNMQMPLMSVEMFYRAVERVKPGLCNRFIFVADAETSRRAEKFIETVDGLLLFKPVKINQLTRIVTLAAARGRTP
jgi:DNA-binding NarL/FixJ family response regulator